MRPTGEDIELGNFLRARRSALSPDDVDVPAYGRRRVPGLRREEVALLAGVSTSYYTRIEQGTAGAVSTSVLTAVADALRLQPDDRAHLSRLARVTLVGPGAAPRTLLPSLAAVVARLGDVPVGVLGRGTRVLAWNRLAHMVFAPHRDVDEPSSPTGMYWAEVLLLDPYSRRHFANWSQMVEDIVGRLGVDAARWPDDPEIAAVIERLAGASREFRELWAGRPARERPLGGTVVDHPVLGRLELTDSVLRSVEDPDQLLLVFHCEPGSDTDAALRTAT